MFTVNAITPNQVDEYDTCKFTAWASDLRWPVGHIPRQIQTTLGNGCYLYLKEADEDKFRYLQLGGCIELTVYND
jgi:hypothetical protein